MKKGNKKILVLAILLLVVAVSYSTYAIYKSSASGEASASVAKWIVKVKGTDITQEEEFTFSSSDIVWDTNDNVKNGKIAPGSRGTISFEIDASEAEVSVDYTVSIDDSALTNSAISIENTGDDASGTILYSDTADDMKKQVSISIYWTPIDDDEDQNPADMELAGQDITIPVTVTATQHY